MKLFLIGVILGAVLLSAVTAYPLADNEQEAQGKS